MRNGAKAAIVGGALTVLIGGAGIGVYTVYDALNGDPDGGQLRAAGAEGSGPVTDDEVAAVTKAFFDAWASGDGQSAAALTDNDAEALTAFTGYFDQAHIGEVRIEPGPATGTTVPYEVTAKVSYEDVSKPLKYRSELKLVRGITTGRALVDWDPSVLHPELEKGETLTTGEASAPTIEAVDRNGSVLDPQALPSLGPVLAQLRERYGAKAGGKPGIELAAHHTVDSSQPDRTLLTLRKGKAGTLRTTLSTTAQKAAEAAVAKYDNASVVALDAATGEVLAVANHRDDAMNAAFEGRVAPGSVMKVVSAAMIIDTGQSTANGPAPCPHKAVSESQTFGNLPGLTANENSTLAEGFALSCNTSFIKFADRPTRPESLTEEATRYFGLGKGDWKTGIVSFDGSVPVTPGSDTAAALIGQGKVQMSPLNIASVAATVKSGAFRQPVIVPQSLDGRELATAEPLNPSTAQQLRTMMNRTAVSGTGEKVMRGLGGDIGAKTGSAEVDTSATSDSWFVGYRGPVAAAALVQDGGHGSDAAGPIVADVLRAGR